MAHIGTEIRQLAFVSEERNDRRQSTAAASLLCGTFRGLELGWWGVGGCGGVGWGGGGVRLDTLIFSLASQTVASGQESASLV